MHSNITSAFLASAFLFNFATAIDMAKKSQSSAYVYPASIDDEAGPISLTVQCKTQNAGFIAPGPDQGTIRAGWITFKGNPSFGGGPYLGGRDETVFCSGAIHGDGKGDESDKPVVLTLGSYKICDQCMLDGIATGANDILCFTGGDARGAASEKLNFGVHMYNGGDPNGNCNWNGNSTFT